MSDTPKLPDEVQKLLDNGHTVILRACGLGTYFAVCVKKRTEAAELVGDAVDKAIGWTGEVDDDGEREFGDAMPGVVGTDDFTPSQALYRLTEKATTGRIVGAPGGDEEGPPAR